MYTFYGMRVPDHHRYETDVLRNQRIGGNALFSCGGGGGGGGTATDKSTMPWDHLRCG